MLTRVLLINRFGWCWPITDVSVLAYILSISTNMKKGFKEPCRKRCDDWHQISTEGYGFSALLLYKSITINCWLEVTTNQHQNSCHWSDYAAEQVRADRKFRLVVTQWITVRRRQQATSNINAENSVNRSQLLFDITALRTWTTQLLR